VLAPGPGLARVLAPVLALVPVLRLGAAARQRAPAPDNAPQRVSARGNFRKRVPARVDKHTKQNTHHVVARQRVQARARACKCVHHAPALARQDLSTRASARERAAACAIARQRACWRVPCVCQRMPARGCAFQRAQACASARKTAHASARQCVNTAHARACQCETARASARQRVPVLVNACQRAPARAST
jgi:hypothetical protein